MTPISATTTAHETARLLGVSEWTLYKSVKDGTCPIPPIRIGKRMVWPRARLAELLGVSALDAVDDADEEQGA